MRTDTSNVTSYLLGGLVANLAVTALYPALSLAREFGLQGTSLISLRLTHDEVLRVSAVMKQATSI